MKRGRGKGGGGLETLQGQGWGDAPLCESIKQKKNGVQIVLRQLPGGGSTFSRGCTAENEDGEERERFKKKERHELQ
jgi:hypothetical protein